MNHASGTNSEIRIMEDCSSIIRQSEIRIMEDCSSKIRQSEIRIMEDCSSKIRHVNRANIPVVCFTGNLSRRIEESWANWGFQESVSIQCCRPRPATGFHDDSLCVHELTEESFSWVLCPKVCDAGTGTCISAVQYLWPSSTGPSENA